MNFKSRTERLLNNGFIIAPIRKRLFAFLIDWAFLIIIYACLMIILKLFNINVSNIDVISIFDVDIKVENIEPSSIIYLKVLFGFLPVLYFAAMFYLFKGQTIGKYLFRIKVISLYHEHLGLWHCIERSLGYFASALEFGFGFIQALWNPNRMTLHDKIGETVVISLPGKKTKLLS